MILYTDKSMEQCVAFLEAHIKRHRRNFVFIKPDFLYQDEIVGNINGTKFWLEKTRRSCVNTISRAFEGELIKENGRTKLNGSFRSLNFQKLCVSVLPGLYGFPF